MNNLSNATHTATPEFLAIDTEACRGLNGVPQKDVSMP